MKQFKKILVISLVILTSLSAFALFSLKNITPNEEYIVIYDMPFTTMPEETRMSKLRNKVFEYKTGKILESGNFETPWFEVEDQTKYSKETPNNKNSLFKEESSEHSAYSTGNFKVININTPAGDFEAYVDEFSVAKNNGKTSIRIKATDELIGKPVAIFQKASFDYEITEGVLHNKITKSSKEQKYIIIHESPLMFDLQEIK